jgi:hypothetical protein
MASKGKVTLATNQGPGSTAAVKVPGGRHNLIFESAAWGGGSATLEIKGPNGAWIAVIAASTANSSSTVDIPPGEYRVTVVTATGVYATLCHIELM